MSRIGNSSSNSREYDHSLKIYTDASKTSDNRTSAAFYVSEVKLEENVRLSDNLTIFAAELVAILLALEWVHSEQNTDKEQEAQLSQRDRAAACLNFGKNISAKSVHLTLLHVTALTPTNHNFTVLWHHVCT